MTSIHASDENAASLRPAVAGTPLALLRLEGAVVAFGAAFAHHQLGGSWAWFLGLFFLPDLAMLGYLAGAKVGSAAYNAAHTYLAPAGLAAVGLAANQPVAVLGALVWAAHIGFDRMLGYGLKYGTAFGDSHLGRKVKAVR